MADRLVTPRPADGVVVFGTTDSGTDAVKEYLERVAKYVPAEIIAAYLTLLPIVEGTTDPDTAFRTRLFFIIFAGCLILTPIYFRFMAGQDRPKRLHIAVSTVAFAVWAYSLRGWFDEIDWYHEGIAAILLVFFSLISGLLAPTEGSQ